MARRPADRKSQILAAAADLFGQHGYHNVSVADIAGRVGITDAALYHHYRDKQDLLLHAVLDGLAAVEAVIAGGASLDGALRSLVALAAGPPQPLALWERESRHLKGPRREPVRVREVQLAAGLVPLLQAARPSLGTADAELIAWAVLGTFSSRVRPPRRPGPEDEQLLYHLGSAAAYSRLPEVGELRSCAGAEAQPAESAKSAGTGAGPLLRSQHDQLLTGAVALFGERGFQSVTVADIGAAAGVVASGVYRHFPSKADLLVAAASEAAQRLRSVADQALAEAGRPREALGLLLRAHVALTIEDRHLIGILAHETAQLRGGERTVLRLQADYLAIWVRLLGAIMPEGEPAELATIIEVTHSMIYLVVRACHGQARPGLPEQLTEIAMTLLLAG